jgi:hypothetical protein
MADRFSGSVYIGGKVTQEQLEKIECLLSPCLEGDLGDDGFGYFYECTQSDFNDTVAYCIEIGASILIQRDTRYELDGHVEYYTPNGIAMFNATQSGRILIPLDQLEARDPSTTIEEFIRSLEIPSFPDLEIVGEV